MLGRVTTPQVATADVGSPSARGRTWLWNRRIVLVLKTSRCRGRHELSRAAYRR